MKRDSVGSGGAREQEVCVTLTLEDVAWIAEIAAGVVRNNCVARPPRDWRQIPSWWEMEGEDCVGVAVDEAGDGLMLEDTVRAVGVLGRLRWFPRLCCLGPHG